VNKLKENPQNNVIYINKEKSDFDYIVSNVEFGNYVKENIQSDKDNYLFVDEVQNIKKFELTLRSLQADEECHIMITGSNAKMFSSELATYLSGRYIEFHIQSLSYQEFLEFHGLERGEETLLKYLDFGGLPQLGALDLANDELIYSYLHDVFNTIVLKDIVERQEIRNVIVLNNLVALIANNIGKLISANSISKTIRQIFPSSSSSGISNYIEYLCNAFVINRVKRYDIRGKQLFENNDKFYFEDLGLRNILTGHNHTKDIEKLIENAVYLHLRNLGYDVYVGQLYSSEIDFVAVKKSNPVYIQATYLLFSDDTIKREFGNLKMINDNFPKYVVSMSPNFDNVSEEGIIHVHLLKFLEMTEL
nr:ATP-binding protein [Bacteroidales bacterium]